MEFFMTTNRCGFSYWNDSDLPLAVSLWGEPEVTKYICASGVFTIDEIESRLHTEINNFNKYGVQYFPVYSLSSGDLIGCCGLRPYNNKKNVYELGFHLRKEYWHNGYAVECATAVIDYAFSKLGAVELKAGHNPNNRASQKILLKLGFQYETKEYYKPTGLYHPLYKYIK
ncbi:MAG: GNAT family N-acetyltransferase [Lachnospiraceae bacterium]|nr:GNAT family N-acetyltransferase [Lachnospiraceae bacterium]